MCWVLRARGRPRWRGCVAGLETADDGEIYFGDRMVQELPAQDRGVGMVFQDLGLWPGLTVVENVGYPLRVRKLSRQDRRHRIAETLTALRIDSLAGRRPDQLTPQQRIRTALARALVTRARAADPRRAARRPESSGSGGLLGRPPPGPRGGGDHDAGPDG